MSDDATPAKVRLTDGLGALMASADGFARFTAALRDAGRTQQFFAAALAASWPPGAARPKQRTGTGMRKHARARKALQAWRLANTIAIPKPSDKPTAYWVGA